MKEMNPLAPNDLEHTVRVMLIKSEEAAGMLESLRHGHAPIEIFDKGTYWLVQGRDEIALDAEDLGDRLGRDVAIEDILVSFATYAGRVEVSGSVVRVTAEFPQIDPEVS